MANIEEWKSEVGPGWGTILDLTDNALEQWIPGYQIAQIKEKYGGLRYYFYFPEDFEDKYNMEDGQSVQEHNERMTQIHNFVHAMEALSYTVCDQCGKPGKLRSSGPYSSFVLCEEHKDGG